MKTDEAKLQAECVRWFRYQFPNRLLFHIPNGGKRSITEAARFKKMGVVAGVPDLFLCEAKRGFNGLFIEMKAGKGKQTEKQIEVEVKIVEAGYKYNVCDNFEDFMALVEWYLD